jgi:hypothetical protein
MNNEPAFSPARAALALVLPFPLRHGYTAQVVVPVDMTIDEAKRFCAFVTSLAAPTLTKVK